ncbi:MAG: hypothetical protein LBE71_02030 [Dysgonamonadaceae bacterium]|jgi:hypothetical protein|nr:hypothetical protein [Dysgonamonadaceae bacterium]
MEIYFTNEEIRELQKLISDFDSFYETEDVWSFNDLDAQREIGQEIVNILKTKIEE